MCQFFSFVGDGFGNYKYFDWEHRKSHLEENCDSHTFILTEARIPPEMQDRWSKYEYNPFTKEFTVDQGVEGHSHEDAEAWVSKLNFKSIVEPLIIREIVDPFKLEKREPTQEDIEDLKKWILVWNLSKSSVWNSIGYIVWDLIGSSVGRSVRRLVDNSLMGQSPWNPEYTYLASFFDLDYGYDLSPFWRLISKGLIPVYNNNMWKLLSGKKAEVVYTKEL